VSLADSILLGFGLAREADGFLAARGEISLDSRLLGFFLEIKISVSLAAAMPGCEDKRVIGGVMATSTEGRIPDDASSERVSIYGTGMFYGTNTCRIHVFILDKIVIQF